MKSVIVFVSMVLLSINCLGQSFKTTKKDIKVNSSDENVFIDYEECPAFPGGEEELLKFIKKNLRYPKSALKDGIEGRVTIRFTIEANGLVAHAKVIRGLTPECDKEALRIVNLMPRWIPMQRPRSCIYTLPDVFKLNLPGPLK